MSSHIFGALRSFYLSIYFVISQLSYSSIIDEMHFKLQLTLAITWLVQSVLVFSREEQHWTSFKLTYGKSYLDASQEDSERRAIFEHNKRKIQHFNGAASDGYTSGVNQFSDLTEHELDQLVGGHHRSIEEQPVKNSPEAEQFLLSVLGNRSGPLPDSIDWRLVVPKRVTEVKNQQLCSSSWAFAATGVLEGQQLNVTRGKELIELSEQNLIDCADGSGGCDGRTGSTFDALEFVSKQAGIDDEKSYPYEAKSGPECKFQRDKVVMSTKKPVLLPEGDEQTLKEVVAKYGPVGIRIEVTKSGFFSYRKGIFKDSTCRNTSSYLHHSMLIVGYGTDVENQADYWLVKNQWSNEWGELGYVRMARNYGNMCGIATRAVIATF